MARPKIDPANHRKKTTIGLTVEEKKTLDEAARVAGVTRARFIREAALACALRIPAGSLTLRTDADPPWFQKLTERFVDVLRDVAAGSGRSIPFEEPEDGP